MSIHPRILADTLEICTTSSAYVRLMNDSRWPWIILIPVQDGIEELHDLTHQQRDSFMADVNQVSRVVQQITACKSVNVAMLGNVVSQLHCHVVARDEGDPNWPAPIWGFGSSKAYGAEPAKALVSAVRKSFR